MGLRRKFVLGAVLIVTGLALSAGGCALQRLPNVPKEITGPAASPPILAAFQSDPKIQTQEDWQNRRAPLLKARFQSEIYGAMPAAVGYEIVSREVLQRPEKGAIGTIERISIALKTTQPGPWTGGRPIVDLILMTPKGKGPFPVIAGGTFCGNNVLLPKQPGMRTTTMALPQECGGGVPGFLVTAIFGLHANAPPWETLAEKGYALASWHPGDVVPDVPVVAEPYLEALTPVGTPPDQRTGAIAAWAWTNSRMVDVLSPDPRLDPNRIVIWGHSRHGKAALLSAAFDPRPAAIWALQSGTAGAALGRDDVGEPVSDITTSFPHWFAPAYRAYAGKPADLDVDQHQLIALLAPRPVLIGTGRRDQWGDPHGSFRALQGADPVYQLYGAPAFSQIKLRQPDSQGVLAFYMRPGLHGIHTEDWEEALSFFDRTVPTPASNAPNSRLKP
ncbi:MAG: hypothetical protein O9270_10085 [Aquidulcibacter sp.]|jgi:hypothetical protein|uniref:alpha/beta hydrolase family protein n=1 Tax=Aquidulcibacter sp. TaxID=2052990 RepID=UPI0022CA5921|nr:hypothetical protein [Aquidulcibacter sp.]MCE2891110.1 hypothetical protein [Hyphomonadaceae bacterium]MCZ8208531.1 hypothetical protein [Aquidulcibacter sp.]